MVGGTPFIINKVSLLSNIIIKNIFLHLLMKRFFSFFLTLFVTVSAFAEDPIYLLPEFTNSVAKMKSGMPIRDMFNYNCETQQLEFIGENNELMKMESVANIDTLWLGKYRLVPYQGHMICVKKRFGKNTLFVDYHIKRVNKGSIGAYGIRTQNGVQQMDRRSYDRIAPAAGVMASHSGEAYVSLDRETTDNTTVYGFTLNNSYVIEIDGKKKSFRNRKTLEKLFPEKATLINEYLENNNTDFSDTDEVATLIEFIFK